MWFSKNCSKNSRKSKKSTIFDKKCSCLVMLSSGSTEIWFQPELPGLYILHQEMVILGIFSNFLSYIHQPHQAARQNVTFWRVGQCMSGNNPFSFFHLLYEVTSFQRIVGGSFRHCYDSDQNLRFKKKMYVCMNSFLNR